MPGDVLLRIDNVSLEYDRPILRNVSAEVRKGPRGHGHIVGFLGPSGCGKTSLFRIIAGLDKPTSGRVSVDGLDRPVRAGEVGVVAQSYRLFNHRNVMGNLLLAAGQKEADGRQAREKVLAMLDEFALLDKASLYPAQLSGGQRQRVAIIQQILCSEHFLLMDEPFSGLDLLMIEKTCALIIKVAAMDDLNTILVVTHDVTAASSVADHLWLMGHDFNAAGQPIPGCRIVREYNLIERELCWHPEIITTARFTDFVREVKEEFRKL